MSPKSIQTVRPSIPITLWNLKWIGQGVLKLECDMWNGRTDSQTLVYHNTSRLKKWMVFIHLSLKFRHFNNVFNIFMFSTESNKAVSINFDFKGFIYFGLRICPNKGTEILLYWKQYTVNDIGTQIT
jgi:hypothetical protein